MTAESEGALSPRLRALGLVLFVTFARQLAAFADRWLGEPVASDGAFDAALLTLVQLVRIASIACLVAYVLARQGRKPGELWQRIQPSDLAWGLALSALALLPFAARDLLVYGAPGKWLTSELTARQLRTGTWIGTLGYAMLPELVLRPYVMAETLALGGGLMSVGAGTALGLAFYSTDRLNLVFSVTSELMFALTYARTRRAMPLFLGRWGFRLWVLLHARS